MDDVAGRFLSASPNAAAPSRRPTLLRRVTSASSSSAAAARRTTTFSDFLSDSDGDGSDEDDAAADLSRMQQQADDMTYLDALGSSPSDEPRLHAHHHHHHVDDDVSEFHDDSFSMPRAPPVAPSPPPPPTTTTTARSTLGRLTSNGLSRPTLLRRLTSGRRKTVTASPVEVAGANGNLAKVDGVIMDSDEDEKDSDGDHDASDSGVSSEYSAEGSSFASSAPSNDDSFRLAGSPYAEDDDSGNDASFSAAMARHEHADDAGHSEDEADEDEVYDNNGAYDDEEEERGRREKELQIAAEQEQEHDHRLSEEPFSEVARASSVAGSDARGSNPYASSFGSMASSGDHFFVDSVRGSSDSVAPLMDLPASPAQVSEIGRSPSANSSLSASPPSMLASSGHDLSFRTSFVPASPFPAQQPRQSSLPPFLPPLAPLGIRVVDHTQKAESVLSTPPTAETRSTMPRAVFDRDSSSSSSSSSLSGASLDDMSFSSNIDDSFTSFTERPRTSSEENLSLVFQKHVAAASEGHNTAQASPIPAIETPLVASSTPVLLKSAPPVPASPMPAPSMPASSRPRSPVPASLMPASPVPDINRSFLSSSPSSPAPSFIVDSFSTPMLTNSVVESTPAPIITTETPPMLLEPVITVKAIPKKPASVIVATVKAAAPGPAPIAATPTVSVSLAAPDLEARKTKTFSKPRPPVRRRGPPVTVSAAIATASTAAGNPPVVATSPPLSVSGIEASIVSSRASDVRLDFTGVYLGENGDINNSQVSKQAPPLPAVATVDPTPEPRRTETMALVDDTALAAANAGPPSMPRIVSAQEASERKVEEFFRKTYRQADDDDMSDFMLLGGSTRSRSKTTVSRAMAAPGGIDVRDNDPPLISNRSRRSSTSAMQLIDLKHLKSGQRIEELLRANEEETKDGDEEEYEEFTTPASVARNRALSRPSARFPIHEDLLEEHYPSRDSEASSVALAARQPPPPRPEEPPVTPVTMYSVTSGSISNSDSSGSFDESEIARPVQPSSNVIQRNFTLSLASGTVRPSDYTVSTQSSPNEIPMPPNYMLSPERADRRPSSSLGSFSSGIASKNSAPSTPQLPALTVAARGVVAGSSAVAASKLASSGVQASPFSSSSQLRSPNPMAASNGMNDVAPGFRWHPDLSQQKHAPGTKQSHESAWSSEESLSIKESVWHAAGALSIGSGRPSMAASVANHMQRASASLKNSFQRARARFSPPNRGNNAFELTSPKSICSAPPMLPRGFDDRQFYNRLGNIQCGDAMIVVNKAGRSNSPKEIALHHKRKTHAWLLFLGALLGIVAGIGLTQVDVIASHFKLLVNPETGEMTEPVAVKWLLLPGSLFLRAWNCVAVPLLFCHVVNGIAELVMTQKAKNAVSFRALGYLLITSLVTTIEGIGLVLVYHALGLFMGEQVSLRTDAVSVKTAVGVIDRVKGMAALMCSAEETYLQVSQNGKVWKCSNETIPLPVYEGIAITTQGWNGSSAAVFAIAKPPRALAALSASTSASGTSASYYPTVLSSVGDLFNELVKLLSPGNVVDSFSKSLAPSVVVLSVAIGLVVGFRAWHRSITAQHHLQQSQSQERTQASVMAESILAKPHPVLGVVVELQQLLEWLVDNIQVFAPLGVASLIAGHIVLHRDEWFIVPGPVISLILGVLIAAIIHVALISPLVLKFFSRVNAWRSLPSFLPALCLSFSTNNVVLSVPTLAHGFESAQVVTKSMSQVGVGIAVAFHRSGNALFYPLAMLFLLESSVPDGAVPMTAQLVFVLGLLTLLSTFLAVGPDPKYGLPGVGASSHLQLILLLFRAWTKQKISGSATMPLLVLADVVLSHVVSLVTTHDHVVFTRLLADHCAELCIEGGGAVGVGASPVYL